MQEKTIEIYKKYLEIFPEDKENLQELEKQIENQENLFDRKNFNGHIVANSLIINGDKVLTIFHNKLKMYLQPGGHVEEIDNSVLEASLREVKEETGLKELELVKWNKDQEIPAFIESHFIPKNEKKNEDEHWHHDFLYVFETKKSGIVLQLEEVSDFEWVKINDILEKDSESFIAKGLKRIKL